MDRRRALLSQKQALLDEVLRAAQDALLALPEREYFDFLIRLAADSAEGGAGVMLLSAKDLSRLPDGFHLALNRALPEGASLDIAPKGAGIDGGFILRYGDIEHNCSVSALFDEKREHLLDAAREVLFG